jgi:hypothetical protein
MGIYKMSCLRRRLVPALRNDQAFESIASLMTSIQIERYSCTGSKGKSKNLSCPFRDNSGSFGGLNCAYMQPGRRNDQAASVKILDNASLLQLLQLFRSITQVF